MKVNIIGYGNQARVWALNLKDTGITPFIVLRKNSLSITKAKRDGFLVKNIKEALSNPDKYTIFCLLIPDENHADFFNTYSDFITDEHLFIFAHGFSISYAKTVKHKRFGLIAPKAIATALRKNYLNKQNLSAVVYSSLQEDKNLILKLARAIGISDIIETNPINEVISDLLTEQSLLCGGVPKLIKTTVDSLVDLGIPKELAVKESIYELKYILDTIIELGFSGFYDAISPVALLGAYKMFKENISLKKSLEDIKDMSFLDYMKNIDLKEARLYLKNEFIEIDKVLKKGENDE